MFSGSGKPGENWGTDRGSSLAFRLGVDPVDGSVFIGDVLGLKGCGFRSPSEVQEAERQGQGPVF